VPKELATCGSLSQRRNLACGSVISKHILTDADQISPPCAPGPGLAWTRSMNDKEQASSRFETEALGKRVAGVIAESQKLVATCRDCSRVSSLVDAPAVLVKGALPTAANLWKCRRLNRIRRDASIFIFKVQPGRMAILKLIGAPTAGISSF
jgi:hypothetical protein